MRLWPGTGLLAAFLVLVLSSVMCSDPKVPVLIGCVFMHRANVTCEWEPGDNQTTHYTLSVKRMLDPKRIQLWTCITTNTSCTVEWDKFFSINYNFCVSFTSHSLYRNVTFNRQCQSGIEEVKLWPVDLKSAYPINAKPKCLNLIWGHDPVRFLIPMSQIQEGKLESQIEFKAHGQSEVMVSNVKVKSNTFEACIFSPDTQYSIRLRHRNKDGTGPWSHWSNNQQGKTAEGAPSSGPKFWRQVIFQGRNRLTSLLWKPLPHALANGKVLFYNITCQDENEVLQDKGNCSNLTTSHTSCVLKLPLGQCSCSISASTSVGKSPRAWVWLSKAFEKERPPPSLLSVTPVSETSLKVTWDRPSAASLSLSGFIVEWFVVTEKKNNLFHWELVNGSATAVVISEGVKPFQRYEVSVRALYGKQGSGQSKTALVYTRQGVPSAGPEVDVRASGSSVTVSWSLPVEKQCGYIQNYILYYETTNQPAKQEVLSATDKSFHLYLPAGHYSFWMKASTKAGVGVPGTSKSVNIGPDEISVVLCVLLPIGLISLLLILMGCLARSKILKPLCQEIPDPSHSSMATWSPKTVTTTKGTMPEIKYSEAVLLNDRENENFESDQDNNLQMCSFPSTPTHYNPFKCQSKYHTVSRTASMADTNFPSCPVIYSVALVSSAQSTASSSSLQLPHRSYPDVKHYRQPQEGKDELCPLKTPFYQMQHQDTSFNVNSFPSMPLLDSFSQTEPILYNTSFPCLPATNLLFLDFMNTSQSSVEFDPYLPV